jgi:SpoU rRNA methylase family enzyme
MTLELKSLKAEPLALLDADGWTVEKLAVTTVKKLMAYKGIGRIGAKKAIAEAAEILNAQGLEDANKLAAEYYYQKSSLAKILADWEDGGLPTKTVALTPARALAALKGIDESLALRLISEAQDIVNKRGLYQSRIAAPGGAVRQTSPAFDEKWLSGEAEPPEMSRRVRRNFEAARREYREGR